MNVWILPSESDEDSQHEVDVISGKGDFQLRGEEYFSQIILMLEAEMNGRAFFEIFLFDNH